MRLRRAADKGARRAASTLAEKAAIVSLMNDYDKAGRYQIKRDPGGFFRWLLGLAVAFLAWLDARRVALPDQGDLTNDLVAAFRAGAGYEALCVELQAESEAASAPRVLLGYAARVATEPGVAGSLPLTAVGGVVINFTGPRQSDRVAHRPTVAPGCWLTGKILQVTLRDVRADRLLAQIAAGEATPWLLPWLPLTRGGAKTSTIDGWKAEALKVPSARDRGILAHLTLTFATLAGNRDVWQRALEGWAVIKSPYLEELREAVRREGRAEGQAEALQRAVLNLGRQRFGKAASRKQKADLEALLDAARLERIHDRLLTAASWDDLLATP